MICRIRFAKYGVLKFIGHLDVMRYFQKVVRRSRLPVKYSQGFAPHQIMSFALPLGLGVTSDGEYMEIEFADDDALTAEKILESMQAQTTEGFELLGIEVIPPAAPNTHRDKSMALVSAADYCLALKDGYEPEFASEEELWNRFKEFYAQESINVNKKTKKSEKEIDVKPYIYLAASTPEDFKNGIPITAGKNGYYNSGESFNVVGNCEYSAKTAHVDMLKHAGAFETELRLYLRLASGSVVNIKPELILESFFNFCDKEYNSNAWEFHRMDLYLGEKKLEPMVNS